MSHRLLATIGVVAVLTAGFAAGQTPKVTTWKPARTADGQPDLQGIWSNAVLTPLERPKEFAGKEYFTEQEADAFTKQVIKDRDADRRGESAEADVFGAYNNSWYDWGKNIVSTRRTSLIIDPPDGKIPPLTPQARQRMERDREHTRLHPADGPEDRSLADRCLIWPTAGPPMMPHAYNNNYQIVQIPGYVMIFNEMIHDARIIPLDGRPHLPKSVQLWLGNSVGHWDGNTLVVDTTNFSSKASFRGSDENLHLLERFTRVSPDILVYEFTIDDPTAFTKPWTAQIPSMRAQGPLYEYACHEGNYAMAGMLGAARAEEAAPSGSK